MQDEDRARDYLLTSMGFKVLRFTNVDVFKNIEGVVIRILEKLE
jgi:very-short-patch-repair endonuclease